MAGPEVVMAALRHDLSATAVRNRLIAEILKRLRRKDPGPCADTRLHRIVGALDCHRPAVVYDYVILLVVCAGRKEQAKADLHVVRGGFQALRAPNPKISADADVGKPGRVQRRILVLRAPARREEWQHRIHAESRCELVSHRKIFKVALTLNFGPQLSPIKVLHRT